MENNIEKKKLSKKVKAAIIAAVVLLAGTSVYAVSAAGSISEAEAREIALGQVSGADNSHITKFRKDFDDGREEYDVEIIYGGFEYDFEISAKDGRIFDQSKERAEYDDMVGQQPSAGQLPAAEAQPEQSVTIELQPEAQQSAEASAQAQAQAQNQASTQPQSQSSAADIGLEKAKSIALAEVSGAKASDIVAAYEDYDDGRLEYDVTILYNNYEYSFEIDSATGKIFGKDVDRMDGYSDYYYD